MPSRLAGRAGIPAFEEAGEFLAGLKAIMDDPRAVEAASTRAAVTEVYLPLENGTIKAEWRELDMRHDVNPLLDLIYEFVDSCAPKE